VQERILVVHHGEMPVGTAEVVPTDNTEWPYLVVAPTMRVPEPVGSTLNAYLAFRALLLAVVRFNIAQGGRAIRSLRVPGLCTGVGGMSPRRCAAQMRVALEAVRCRPRIAGVDEIHRVHRAMLAAT
jgi:O-acetyl-ADP-ribose deacetylase (regulator of RNase III)